ncbi:hypothetical protein D3C80_1642230 [compost metagenome]
MLQNCRNIRADEVFAFSNTDYKRACKAYSHQTIRFMLCQYAKCECTAHTLHSTLYSFNDVPFIFISDQMRDDLCIRLRYEYMACRD